MRQGDVLFSVIPKNVLPKTVAVVPGAKLEVKPVILNAPFDGIVGRLAFQPGTVVRQGETLTTLSDISLMWVYFNVPDTRYLQYMAADLLRHKDELKIELVLANGEIRSARQAQHDRG